MFTTKLFISLQFAVHSWIVTVNHGKIKRGDVWQNKNLIKTSWDYLYQDIMKPWIGMNKYGWKLYPRNKSKIIGYLEGGKNSLAEKMVKFIEKEGKKYPLRKKYKSYPGPNSNTFPQWIINKFPESNWNLPWNAFGKNYAKEL